MQTYVQVTQVKNDREWLAEMHEYGYDNCDDMYVAVGDFDYNFADDLQIVHTRTDEDYAFMCGNTSDRRCYNFTIDVHTCAEGKQWITEEAFNAIG
tara:strand:- start:714 stop:1001 length:288 start_codon:yes stop_codon:yes gene_type:complete